MGLTTNEGLSVADAIALQDRNGDGFGGGGSGYWIFFLFFLLIYGGAGFGGYGGNGALNQISNDFIYTNLNNTIDRGFNQLSNQNFSTQKELAQMGFNTVQAMNNGFHGVDNALCHGFNSTQREIMENRFAAQQCCCETNRNIDAVRFENAKNTCDITTNANFNTRDIIESQTAGFQRIADILQQEKIDSLRTELQAAQLQLGNLSQTTAIVNAIRPFPQPAYITCSPYTSMYGGGCGYNC